MVKTVRVKVLRNTVAGGVAVNEGEIVDVSESDAKFLIQIKKAEAVEEKAKAKKATEPGDEKTKK